MQCDYFDAGACGSCVHLRTPYADQLAAKDAAVRALLGGTDVAWEAPYASAETGFRAKSKMVAGGTPDAPTLGILGPDRRGVDLRGCRLLGPGAAAAMPVLARSVTRVGLRPYDVPTRSGELKGVHVVEDLAGEGALMVRFVLRSEGQLGKLRAGLPALLRDLAAAGAPAAVVSANLLPQHAALPEGDVEIVLTQTSSLPLRVGDVRLYVDPGAFLQTNTAVAGGLYRQAREWAEQLAPRRVLDLYCGVGGFALHLAGPGRSVHGVETSAPAVAAARRAAGEGGHPATFEVGDATAAVAGRPDLVVVNPPRRGIGPRLAGLLEGSGVPAVLYSSCHPQTLVRDLAAMPSLRAQRARLFDMFPHTDHAEVLVLLVRD